LNQAQGPQHPQHSVDKTQNYINRLGLERKENLFDRLRVAGQAVGISFNFAGKIGPSRDSHRLIHLAGTKSSQIQNNLVEALFKAHCELAKDLSDHTILLDCARKAGLDDIDARMWLTDQADGAEVDELAKAAREGGITGVPHFNLNDRFEVAGAQDSLAFVRLFERLVKLNDGAKV
jgi:predicted DsbA family dithiol-disulfide isomerase